MRPYTITTPLWLLLGLPIVLATKQVSSPDYIEYLELNIYLYQRQVLFCMNTDPLKPVFPTPLKNGEYYVENPLENVEDRDQRDTGKLKDDFPELKFVFNGKFYFVYYTAPGKRKNVQRIYFECIDAASGSTNIIQLSIMPEEKYLPKEERIIFDELPVPKGKELFYFKFARPGVKTITECRDSELVLNDGIGVSVKKPEAKVYTNPVTMVEYQDITDYVTKHQATENTHIIDLMDGRVANINEGNLIIRCKNKPENKLIYMSSHMDGIPGLNAYYQPDGVLDDGSMKIIQIKTEKDTQVLVDVPIKTGVIFPNDCLNNVFTATGKVVKLSDVVRNAKLARITDSFKILDLSTSSSYREITVSCFVNRSQRGVWSKGTWMNLTISPQCNFYDPQALDSDGKTCTVFASSHVDSLVATQMDSLESPETFEMEEAFFMRSDDPKGTCKDCHYKRIDEQDDGISVSITNDVLRQKIMIIDGVIKHNPVYILRKEEVKGGNEVLNPTHALRMYLYNHETEIIGGGRVIVAKDHQVKSDGESTFYRVQIGNHVKIKISCKDFFEDSGPLEPILFPSGYNTVFENVSDGDADPRTIKTVPFEKLFQSKGISIVKKHVFDTDLEILAVPESVIQSDHHRPIYFICSTDVQGDWKSNKKPYAVIAIDPGYTYNGPQDLPEEEDPPIVIDDPPDQPEEEGALLEPKQVLDVDTTNIDGYGNVTAEISKVKSGGISILYRVQPGNKRDIKISCKDFLEDSGSSGYTLFPNGKNTIFENVSDGSVDPKTIKTIQFEQDFASMGISILKMPETDVDLQLIFDEDKLVQNEYIKPIYFICAQSVQGEWKDNEKPYAVIAIDPGYEIRKLQGCGVKDGMFLGQGESSITGNQCMHTVDDETRIGFHCPSYVPEHFLEGDQSKHKAAEDAEVGNPYQLLLRCYDRSSVGKRMFRPKRNLGLFSRPKFAGELRSLWVFDKELFAEKKHLTDILCTCYDKTGKAISHIKIKNDTNKNE